MRNTGGFWDPAPDFRLENFHRDENGKGKQLAKVVVEGTEEDIKKDVEFSDSDSSGGESDDDLFGFEEDECKVKLKWKIKKVAKIFDANDNEVGKLKFKGKGKSTGEAESIETRREDEEGNEHFDVSWNYSAKSKVKKVIYKLEINDKAIPIEFKDGHW